MNRGRHRKKQHLVVRVLGTTVSNKMMEYQVKQGNASDLDVFLREPSASRTGNGFNWCDTTEGWSYWNDKIEYFRNHSLYLKYQNDRSKGFY